MKRYIRKTSQIFSMIFTLLVLMALIRGGEISTPKILHYLLTALVCSLTTIVLYKADYSSTSQFIFYQVLYLALVNGLVFVLETITSGSVTFIETIQNFFTILIFFLFIRWSLYREDRKLAEDINSRLHQMKNKDSFSE